MDSLIQTFKAAARELSRLDPGVPYAQHDVFGCAFGAVMLFFAAWIIRNLRAAR